MIAVLPIENKEEQARLAASCHITFLPNSLAYAAYTEDVLLGICQFGRDGTGGHIFSLAALPENGEPDTLFLLGRAALNFLDLCGSATADYVGDDAEEKDGLLRRIGFTPDDARHYRMTLTGFFTTPCKH